MTHLRKLSKNKGTYFNRNFNDEKWGVVAVGWGGRKTQFEMLCLMNSAAFVAMYHCHHFETALNVSDRQQFVVGVK
jgi:hypothetical protein